MIRKLVFWSLVLVAFSAAALFSVLNWGESLWTPYLSSYVQKNYHLALSIADLDVSLLKGQLSIRRLSLTDNSRGSFSADLISADLSVRDLLAGTITLTDVTVRTPTLKYPSELFSHFASTEKTEAEPSAGFKLPLSIRQGAITGLSLVEVAGDGKTITIGGGDIAITGTASSMNVKEKISTIVLQSGEKKSDFGTLTAEQDLGDNLVSIQSLNLSGGLARLNAEHFSVLPKINGTVELTANPADFLPAENINAPLAAKLSLDGVSDDLHGTYLLNSTGELQAGTARFKELHASGSFAKSTDSFRAGLEKLDLDGSSGFIHITEPITISNDELSGRIDLDLGPLKMNAAEFQQISANFTLNGTVKKPLIEGKANVAGLKTGAVSFGPTDITLANDGLSSASLLVNEAANPEGSLALQAKVSFADKPVLESAELSVERSLKSAGLSIKGTASAHGPLAVESLQASAEFSGTVLDTTLKLPFDLKANLESGVANLTAHQETAATIEAGLLLVGEQKGTATFSLDQNDLRKWYPSAECGAVSAKGNYDFILASPAKGSGAIKFNKTQFGCDASQVTLGGSPVVINDGKAVIENLLVQSGVGALKISGTAAQDNLDLHARGDVDFSSFASFVPSIESLSGKGHIDLSASGAPAAPELSGSAIIKQIALELPEPAIELSGFNARIGLSGHSLNLTDLSGTLNEGTLSGSGSADLADIPGTVSAKLDFSHVYLQPVPDTEVTMSGSLAVSTTLLDGRMLPKLAGTINIDDGMYEKQFSLDLVREKLASVFKSSGISLAAEENKPPSLVMELAINGDSSMVVNTNLLRAELSPKLKVTGPSNEIAMRGVILVPTGWFDIGKSRFEITNGSVRFTGDGFVPELLLSAETRVQDTEGFPVTIFFELSGPATDPRVLLSSDNGLPQEKILKLITAGQGLNEQGLVNSAVKQAGFSQISLLGDNTFFGALSRIDQLTIEPSYNAATGEVGSKVVSSERLTDKLKASAELPFVGRADQPQVSLSLQLLDYLGAVGSLRLPQDQIEQSYGGDLNWRLINGEAPSPVSFVGTKEIGPVDLASEIGVSARTSLNPARIPVLEKRLLSYYHDRSFLDASVSSTCTEECAKVTFTIVEGPRFFVDDVQVQPDLSALFHQSDTFGQIIGVELATKDVLDRAQKQLFDSVRKNGYPRARLKAFYERTDKNKVILHLTGVLKNHFEIHIAGNHNFSDRALLDSYRYYDRSIAFTPIFPYELRLQLERFYHERGYALMGAAMRIDRLPNDDVILWYDLFEGPKVKVERVKFDNSPITPSELSVKLTNSEYRTIFSPSIYNPDAARAGTSILRNVLQRSGYPEAQVTLQEEKKNYTTMNLRYVVKQGAAQKFALSVTGLPAQIIYEYPGSTLSLSEVKEQTKAIERIVRQAGYFETKVTHSEDSASGIATVHVNPGVQRRFGAITISGNQLVRREVIEEALPIHDNEPFSWQQVGATRRSLFKMGLFNKVDVRVVDSPRGAVYRDVNVVVEERPLSALSMTTGYDSTYGAHLGFTGTDRSWFKDGREITLRSDLYYDLTEGDVGRGFASVRFRDPQLTENTSWSEELGYLKTLSSSFQDFETESAFLRSELQYSVNENLNLKASHALEQIRTTDVPADVILSDLDEGKVLLSTVGAGIFFADQDDPVNPHVAKKASLETRVTSSAIDSDADYITFLPRISFLQPLPWINDRFSFLASGQGGAAQPFGDTSEVPLPRRFYLGGQDSVRGYEENSLGRRGNLGHIIGGDRFYAGTGELRYEILDNITVLTFVDAGQIWRRSEQPGPARLATGIGGRYNSPVGAVGVDIGVPLNPDDGADAYEIYFRIGATF